MREKLRVILADDERPARSVLRALLEGFDDVAVVGEARDGAEAISVIEAVRPDLALLDFEMPSDMRTPAALRPFVIVETAG